MPNMPFGKGAEARDSRIPERRIPLEAFNSIVTADVNVLIHTNPDLRAPELIVSDNGSITHQFQDGKLTLKTTNPQPPPTATIELPPEYTPELTIRSKTGNVQVRGGNADLNIQTESGNVSIANAGSPTATLEIKTDSGTIGLYNVQAASINAVTETGDLLMGNTSAMHLEFHSKGGGFTDKGENHVVIKELRRNDTATPRGTRRLQQLGERVPTVIRINRVKGDLNLDTDDEIRIDPDGTVHI